MIVSGTLKRAPNVSGVFIIDPLPLGVAHASGAHPQHLGSQYSF